MWKHTEEQIVAPKVELRWKQGDIMLAIDEDEDGRQWEYVALSFGQFKKDSLEGCQKTWPREAIRLVRKALDDFEATLDMPR
jgi:hypothetical protein